MYAELKCKSNFSFLRGASDSREYVKRAGELMIPAIAITDINGIYALPRAYEELKKIPHTKLISGCELRLLHHPPITLVARNKGAWSVMCKLITKAHAGKEKGTAVLTLPELISGMEDKRANGLICIADFSKDTSFSVLKEIFGGRLYLPLTRYFDGKDKTREQTTKNAAKSFDCKIIATNDPHYHHPERRELQDTLTCIREKTNYRDAGFKLFGNDERYLKSPHQMFSLYKDFREALSNTLEIAESCTFDLSELKYTYPRDLTPEGHTPQSYFEHLVTLGAHEKYKGLIPQKVDEQIQHEFRLIKKMEYASYFLTIHEIVAEAKKLGIVCQGRGSAANSISCFCLGITSVDSVKEGLLFERFISEERGEPPDIDIDFEHERREEIIQFIYKRYGRHRAALVAAVQTYKENSSFRDIAKAIGVDVGTASAQEVEKNFEKFAGKDADKLPVIRKLQEQIADMPRQLSTHPGGFVISDEDITEIIPIEPAAMENRTVLQIDKDDADTLGLCKVDCLSIGFLTAMSKACKLIGLDWMDIPSGDPETYAMIRRAETDGTFQIESRAQKAMLPRTQPERHYDLVAQVSLVRPGPNVGGMVHPFVQGRMNERRGIPYQHPDPILHEILQRTYGVPLFQEQVMKISIQKAGFKPGEADQLRRSISWARSVANMGEMADRLYAGLINQGMPETEAKTLFKYMSGYSNYGFPESHAHSYANIAYKSAYLKCHYPTEFICGILSSEPFGFYSVDYLVQSFARSGVRFLPIHPNLSFWNPVLENGAVRMGFKHLNHIREADALEMVKTRAEKPFSDMLDFMQRVRFPRIVIENMALAGLFECFGLGRRDTFWSSTDFYSLFDRALSHQLPLFGELEKPKISETKFKDMNLLECILADHHAHGYSLLGNAMKGIRSLIPLPMVTSAVLKSLRKNRMVKVAGQNIIIQRPPTAKGNCFITLEDEFGTMDVIVKASVYENCKDAIKNFTFIEIEGAVQENEFQRTIIATNVRPLAGIKADRIKIITPGEHPRSLGSLNDSYYLDTETFV